MVICIHQRLHEDDPAGHLLETGAYSHLNLPAIAEEDEEISLSSGRVFRREKGTVLFPQRFDLEALEAARRERGTARFQMLYQQNPIAAGASPLKWEWFQTYDEVLDRSKYEMVVQSWDTGSSADDDRAYSVCTTWGFRERNWHLLEVYRDRIEYPDLKRKTAQLVARWNPDKVLIEKASSGIQLLQDYFPEDRRRFVAIKADRDKEVRFEAACALVEEGRVYLPREADWLAIFKRELLGFPRTKYKDQADSFSQFLNWSKGQGFWRSLDREHPLRVERRARLDQKRQERRRD